MICMKDREEKTEQEFTSNHLPIVILKLTNSAYCGCFYNGLVWECQRGFLVRLDSGTHCQGMLWGPST